MRDNINVGRNCRISKDVLLGEIPSRNIKISNTSIGDNALIRAYSIIYTNVNIGDNFETGYILLKLPL